MMNKASYLPVWDMMRLRHGMALRLIEMLPADKLDSRPIANMRTPKELVAHMYAFMRMAPEGVLAGKLGDSPKDVELAKTIPTRDALLEYAKQAWVEADATVKKLTDAHFAAMVPTPWGQPFPGGAIMSFVPDEFLHHRGQLYAYARVLGVEPPMRWDFEHNAPEFQMKAPASS